MKNGFKRWVLLNVQAVLFCLISPMVFAQSSNLYIQNPQVWWSNTKGRIQNVTLSFTPKGVYTEVGLYMRLSGTANSLNPQTQYEIVFDFSLPEGSIVTDSWLWVGEDIIQAKILDRWTASQIYENIVNRRRDPSLLTSNGNNTYQLRIYPMLGNESRQVKITYLVPNTWTGESVSIPLPLALLKASDTPVEQVIVQSWAQKGWTNTPNLNGMSSPPSFYEAQHATLGAYKVAILPSLPTSLSISFPNPMKNGLLINHWKDQAGTGWYEMVASPRAVLDYKPSRRFLFLIDYDQPKSFTMENIDTITNALQQAMTTHLAPSDSFNVGYTSGLYVKTTSTTWQAASAERIRRAFDIMRLNGISAYTNMLDLFRLSKSLSSQNIHVVLLSTSDVFAQATDANRIISDLLGSKKDQTKYSIIDMGGYQNASIFINNQRLYGNEYLYQNLTRQTGGEYWQQIRSNYAYSATSLIQTSIQAMSEAATDFDIYLKPENGFSYAKSGLHQSLLPLATPFIQTGKYLGTPNFTAEVTGLFQNKPFSKTLRLEADQNPASNAAVSIAWAAQQIAQLRQKSQTNEVVKQIIELSTKYRILTTYTAFLALEPSQGGEICIECLDGRKDPIVPIEDETAAPAQDALEVYPNPTQSMITISVSLAQTYTGLNNAKLEIYNILGKKIRTISLSAFAGQHSFKTTWDTKDEAGNPVANGVYMLVIVTSSGKRLVQKVVVQR